MTEFLAMGAYTSYVWSAVGCTLFTLLLLYIHARRRLHKALKQVNQPSSKYSA